MVSQAMLKYLHFPLYASAYFMRMKKEIKSPIQSEDAENLFKYLPSEIMIDILLRLPNETIMRCKCICKAWRDFLETRDFVQSHFSKSVPGLAVFVRGRNSKRYRIVEFVDEHRLNIVFSVDLPFVSYNYIQHSSANGLLFVCKQYDNRREVSFVCNPITREYIRLPSPLEASPQPTNYDVIYGFGVSKMSGEYKVVRMSSFDAVDCQVYTVGSGSWRRIEFDDQLWYKGRTAGAFLNGNLHWVAYNKHSYHHDLICCFDLETERFITFSPPPRGCSYYNYRVLSVLGDYLCVCDTFVERDVVGYIEIWLMKEYGDVISWTKEFHFDSRYAVDPHCPIKVFKDGDVLMEWGYVRSTLLYYSKRHGRETIEKVDLFKDDDYSRATIYPPSILPLKTFTMENVSSF